MNGEHGAFRKQDTVYAKAGRPEWPQVLWEPNVQEARVWSLLISMTRGEALSTVLNVQMVF